MPELRFYPNMYDKQVLIKYLLEEGASFVPDNNYPEPEAFNLSEVELITPYLSKHVQLFIIHDSYSKSNFQLSYQHSKQFYYIKQIYGGPSICLSVIGTIEKDGDEYIGLANLSYYPSYYDIEGEREVKASKELKEFYAHIVNFIKQNSSKQVVSWGKRAWVGKGAFQDYQNGIGLYGVK